MNICLSFLYTERFFNAASDFTLEMNKFSFKDFFSPQKAADLVTFTEKIFKGKLHFLCSDSLIKVIKHQCLTGL